MIQTIPERRLSAFGQYTVVEPFPLADIVMAYDIPEHLYGQSTSGGGAIAYSFENAGAGLTVGATSGDIAILRTHEHYRYQAGRGKRCLMTCFHSDGGQPNQVRRWGMFNGADGVYFRLDGTTLQVARDTSSGSIANDRVDQAAWNIDRLDGSGGSKNPSGVNLDLTKGNIFEIRFQWLGVGAVDFFVNGIHVHQMEHANTIAGPYMRTGNLPVTWEVENEGASASGTLNAICASVYVEGARAMGDSVSFAAERIAANIGATATPIISIRPKATFGGGTNRGSIFPKAVSVACNVDDAIARLVLNPTLTGAAWSSVDANSIAEQDTDATGMAGGTIVAAVGLALAGVQTISLEEFFAQQARKLLLRYPADTADILTLAVQRSGGSPTATGSITWNEIR